MRIFYKKLSAGVVGLAVCGSLVADTSPVYENFASVTEAPQIDATAFFNYGSISLFTGAPFTTLNTRSFYNRGTMSGSPGFILNHDPGSGSGPTPATSIHTEGSIVARDGTIPYGANDVNYGGFGFSGSVYSSWLELNATNIVARGLLSAGNYGLLRINAKESADLTRAGLRTGTTSGSTFTGFSGFYNGRTNFFSEPGIADIYWGVGTNQVLSTDPARQRPLDLNLMQLNLPNPETPEHEVTRSLGGGGGGGVGDGGFFNGVSLPFDDTLTNVYSAFVRTNVVGGTNIIIQVVFVATNLNSGNLTTSVDFIGPSVGATSPRLTLTSRTFDSVLNEDLINQFYIQDDLARISNSIVSVNLETLTGRPSNYDVGSGGIGFIGGGGAIGGASQPPNQVFRYSRHIYDSRWTYSVVTNRYTAYSFGLNTVVRPNDSLGSINNGFLRDFRIINNIGNPYLADWYNPTNGAGRVEILSEGSLNLERTRLRGERYVSVQSPDVSFGADGSRYIDSPVVSLNLGSMRTNELLNIENLIPKTVDRITGEIRLWSAAWTNEIVQFGFDPDSMTITSNAISILNYVTFMDQGDLSSVAPVQTSELLLKSNNGSDSGIRISDNINVQNSLVLESPNVTVVSTNFYVGSFNLGATNFVGTVNLTNSGFIYSYAQGGMALTMSNLNNSGSIFAGLIDVAVTNLVNSGELYSTGGQLRIQAETAELANGALVADNDIFLNIGTLNITDIGSRISAGTESGYVGIGSLPFYYPGRLHINVDKVNDGPKSSMNFWDVTDGFEMADKPAEGDFSATILRSFAYQFGEVVHTWGAEDRGTGPEGFVNNAAVATLVLDGQNLSRFTFVPVTSTSTNAMYVQYLSLRGYAASDPEDAIYIAPGMKIYYTDSNVPESNLQAVDGLVRVESPAVAPASNITLASGQVFTAREELLNSMTVDSDADGVVNGLDLNPFDDVVIDVKVVNEPKTVATISWKSVPLTEYQLEYKDTVDAATWTVLKTIVTVKDQQTVTVVDEPTENTHRYYRVIYTP